LCYIGMSIETGCEEIRNQVLHKQVRDSHILEAVQRIHNSVGDNLCVNTSFIVFFPGDTIQSRIGNIKWMDYLSKRINITFSGPQIYRSYPGTRLCEMESKPVYGDLEHYMKRLSPSGSQARLVGRHEAFFYSTLLSGFFNTRFRFLDFSIDQSNQPRVSVRGRGVLGGWQVRLWFSIVLFLMLPIRIRIRLNFWRFFIEPSILGFLGDTILELGKFFKQRVLHGNLIKNGVQDDY